MYETEWTTGTPSIAVVGAVNHFVNPQNALILDGIVTTITTNGSGASDQIAWTDFEFDLPSNAVITGILMKVKMSRTDTSQTQHDVKFELTTDADDASNRSQFGFRINADTSLTEYVVGSPSMGQLNAYGFGPHTTNNGSSYANWTNTLVNRTSFGVRGIVNNSSNGLIRIDVVELKLFWAEAFIGSTGTGTTDNLATTHWTSPGNISASDNTRTQMTASSTAGNNDFLLVKGFGLEVPRNYVINGIIVQVERLRRGGTSGEIRDNTVQLLKAGTRVGRNYAATSTNWGTSDTTVSYGETNDRWGVGWLPSDVNNANFGVAIRVVNTGDRVAEIDYVRVLVYAAPPEEVRDGIYRTGWMTAHSSDTLVRGGSSRSWTASSAVRVDNFRYADFASSIQNGQYRDFLRLRNFGLAIPTEADIEGMEVRVNRYAHSGNSLIRDSYLGLVQTSTLVGDSMARTNSWSRRIDPTNRFYGGQDERWGFPFVLPTDLNDRGFGVVLSVLNQDNTRIRDGPFVDAVEFKAYYSFRTAKPLTRETNWTKVIATAGQTKIKMDFWLPLDITNREIVVLKNNVIMTSGYTLDFDHKLVTLSSPLALNDEILVYRRLDKDRLRNFAPSGAISRSALNEQLNKAIAFQQDEQFRGERFALYLTLPEGITGRRVLVRDSYRSFLVHRVIHQNQTGRITWSTTRNGVAEGFQGVTRTISRQQTDGTLIVNRGDSLALEFRNPSRAVNTVMTLQCTKLA